MVTDAVNCLLSTIYSLLATLFCLLVFTTSLAFFADKVNNEYKLSAILLISKPPFYYVSGVWKILDLIIVLDECGGVMQKQVNYSILCTMNAPHQMSMTAKLGCSTGEGHTKGEYTKV